MKKLLLLLTLAVAGCSNLTKDWKIIGEGCDRLEIVTHQEGKEVVGPRL